MTAQRVAMLSVHTSPLDQPGAGDGGGMNVYVEALARALAAAGIGCDVFTRAARPHAPAIVETGSGVRVVHIDAGPRRPLPKETLSGYIDEFVASARAWIAREGVQYDVLHANYWISGAVGHALKHELDIPLVTTFHSLARVKAAAGMLDDPPGRATTEADVVRCADRLVASTAAERDELIERYGAEPYRVEIIPPGVDHHRFSPGDQRAARRQLRLGPGPVLLFVGRIQPLKGVDLAVRCLAALPQSDARLLIVGGPSGADGDAEARSLVELSRQLGVASRVQFVSPVRHDRLVDYYRAADVCLVPSRTESFGLVALEAAASGTPVVASAVGGLRALVDDGITGFLVEDRSVEGYAAPVAQLLADHELRSWIGHNASVRSDRYSWSIGAARLRRLYADVAARALVQCS
ncbi:MAG: glycosyltransferase family 1 protein [Actinobacteria bacterium]|nr:MAG: glycosyltransferase family 1 protein [Actinomycetota bacterium]